MEKYEWTGDIKLCSHILDGIKRKKCNPPSNHLMIAYFFTVPEQD